jgi:REP element-mobilizing transposase RayT
MSTGYQITSQNVLYFVTFTIVDWVDIFSRKIYRDIIVDSLNYCISNKGLKVYAWVIMTNHIHLIIESENENSSDVIRDIKKFTAYKIIETIKSEPESRREWIPLF